MRKSLVVFVLVAFSNNIFVNASSVSKVDLIDYRSYVVSILQETMNRVENNHWCNLKIDNMYMNISENVLGTNMSGTVEFTDGFLVSLEKIDIIESTVQRSWVPTRGNTTNVEVKATMRMLNFVIGFDVLAKLEDNEYHSTGVIRYPEIRFPFVISKNLFTDAITVTVSSQLIGNQASNFMVFLPENKVTKVITVLFKTNSITDSFQKWAAETFAPIAQDLVENDIEFPKMCYNC
ncbi:unnamed protein product [Euphydryas editha]|uniref:Uncharacterized protein n=1 Tax=Euphydryas editha TaxID=104508 RepID=A0AAU9VD30_EUPED|nr:unnamed protein product [Euphydryas editha]